MIIEKNFKKYIDIEFKKLDDNILETLEISLKDTYENFCDNESDGVIISFKNIIIIDNKIVKTKVVFSVSFDALVYIPIVNDIIEFKVSKLIQDNAYGKLYKKINFCFQNNGKKIDDTVSCIIEQVNFTVENNKYNCSCKLR